MNLRDASQTIRFFCALGAEDLDDLLSHASMDRFEREQTRWVQGSLTDAFAFLVRGRFKMVRGVHGGREVIVELAMPGDLLCANAVYCCTPCCCSAVAMEDGAEVLTLPRKVLMRLLERSHKATLAFLNEITQRGKTQCSRTAEVASGRVPRRIAALFLRLARSTGIARAEGTWIPVDLSRQELADLCGTSIETTIRIMTGLRRDEIVKNAARGFLITDIDALRRIGGAN